MADTESQFRAALRVSRNLRRFLPRPLRHLPLDLVLYTLYRINGAPDRNLGEHAWDRFEAEDVARARADLLANGMAERDASGEEVLAPQGHALIAEIEEIAGWSWETRSQSKAPQGLRAIFRWVFQLDGQPDHVPERESMEHRATVGSTSTRSSGSSRTDESLDDILERRKACDISSDEYIAALATIRDRADLLPTELRDLPVDTVAIALCDCLGMAKFRWLAYGGLEDRDRRLEIDLFYGRLARANLAAISRWTDTPYLLDDGARLLVRLESEAGIEY